MQSTRSPFWYLLPVFLGIIGGVIAYFILKNSDKNKAERAIIIGIIFSIPMCILFTSQLILGTDPWFIMSSNGMYPEIQINDIVVVDVNAKFDGLRVGDVIAFYAPKHLEKGNVLIMISRVTYEISHGTNYHAMYGYERVLRTQGDDNDSSVRGINFPITENEYIGKVKNVIPQIGILTISPFIYFLIASYFVVPTIFIYFLHATKENAPSDTTSKKEIASKSDSTKICPLCKSQNILHDMRNSQYRCSDCNWSGYISKKYSDVWYLLPIIIGIIGGLIFYLVIKDDDKEKAIKGLIIGIIMSVVSIILYVILIISTGFLF
jgi:signal peptidase I